MNESASFLGSDFEGGKSELDAVFRELTVAWLQCRSHRAKQDFT